MSRITSGVPPRDRVELTDRDRVASAQLRIVQADQGANSHASPRLDPRARVRTLTPGVESADHVAERARAYLASVADADGSTLVVGHGRMLRMLISVAPGLPPSFAQSLRMRNCRPAVLEPGPTPLLLAFNAGDPAFEAQPKL